MPETNITRLEFDDEEIKALSILVALGANSVTGHKSENRLFLLVILSKYQEGANRVMDKLSLLVEANGVFGI